MSPTNNVLEIILKLRDEASEAFQRATNRIRAGLEEFKKNVDRLGDSMVLLGRQISQTGKNMTFLGALITGSFAVAFKTASNYSVDVREQLKKLDDAFKSLQIVIADAILPVVDKLSNLIAQLANWFKNIDPEIRNTSLQILLVTGIFLTLGGAIMNVVGKMASLLGRMLQFASAHPVILLIVAALALMIIYWEKIRSVAIPVLNSIELALNTVAIGFYKIIWVIADGLEGLTRGLESVLDFLSKIPGPQQAMFEGMKEGAHTTAEFFREVSIASADTISDIEKNMTKILETGEGNFSKFADNSIASIKNLWDFFANPPVQQINMALEDFSQNFNRVFTDAYEQAVNLGAQSGQILVTQAQTLSKGLGDAVANMVIYGKNFGESMKQMAQQMAAKFISSVIEMGAQWLIFQALQAIFIPMMVGAGTAAAMTLGTIWAPVAAMVSLATLGGNAEPAAAALVGTSALAQGLAIAKLAKGGIVTSPTLALIGEAGPEAVVPLSHGGAMTNITIHVNNPVVRDEQNIKELTEAISKELAFEIERL